MNIHEEEIKSLKEDIDRADNRFENLKNEHNILQLENNRNKQLLEDAKKKAIETFEKTILNYQSLKVLIELIQDSRTHFVKIEMCQSANNIMNYKYEEMRRLLKDFKELGDLSDALPF